MKAKLHAAFAAIFLAVGIGGSAASPEKQIMSHSAGDDMIVFVKPRTIPTANKQTSAKPITYDLTLSTQSDSVAVTYTLIAPNSALHADSTIINGSSAYPNERIFVEPKSKNWTYRLRFKMPYSAFSQDFCGENELRVQTGDCLFTLPAKKQAKEAEINRAALKIIELNKK